MMHNSLDRLLEGIVRTLIETVAPAVDDPYAAGQVNAAAELLANIATRVTWDPGYMLASAETTRELLRELGFETAVDAPEEPGSVALAPDALEAYASAHLAALAELAAAGASGAISPHDRERVAAAVDGELDQELARLRGARLGR
jgi:hypothetical protein